MHVLSNNVYSSFIIASTLKDYYKMYTCTHNFLDEGPGYNMHRDMCTTAHHQYIFLQLHACF